MEPILTDHFLPHIEPLKAVFNFSIESQLLYHAPLSFEPTYGIVPGDSTDERLLSALNEAKDGDEAAEEVAAALMGEEKKEAWMIDKEEIKVLVNSERWSLGLFFSTRLSRYSSYRRLR